MSPVALVTGGSRGIGRATALRLAEDGFDIALCYAADRTAAEDLEKQLIELGRRVFVRQADVADGPAVQALVADAEQALGPITAVVSSAGITRDNPLVLMPEADWRAVLGVNLDGVYHVCRAAVFQMMKRRAGAIVTLSSVAGVYGKASQTNYAASKAGIIGFTKSLAKEVGRYGIRANVVAPGFIETDMTAAVPERVLDQARQQVPLGRFGTAGEVAELISYLVSERAGYVTGAVFAIDGGIQL